MAVWSGVIRSAHPSHRRPSPERSETSTARPCGRRRSEIRCRMIRRANSRPPLNRKPEIAIQHHSAITLSGCQRNLEGMTQRTSRSDSHATKQPTWRTCRSELVGTSSRAKKTSISIWSNVIPFPQTAQSVPLAGPLKRSDWLRITTSGCREGSCPLRIAARAFSRRILSSDIWARTIAQLSKLGPVNCSAISGICETVNVREAVGGDSTALVGGPRARRVWCRIAPAWTRCNEPRQFRYPWHR
jgi:hypothetical protein